MALASNLIHSGIFMLAIAGLSNSIVLPSLVPRPSSSSSSTHLDNLIRDIFVTYNGNGNSSAPSINASLRGCWGRCIRMNLPCVHDNQPDQSDNTLYDDAGDGFLDVRIAMDGDRSERRFCEADSEKCCRSVLPNIIAPLASRPTVVDEGTPRIAFACGFSASEATMDRVISDGTIDIDEFPWMAAILWRTPTGETVHKCGSTLIHPSVVLTVAHCVFQTPAARLLVRVGQRDVVSGRLGHSVSKQDHQARRIRQVIIHKHFNASRYSLHNDIALLFLDTPVQMSESASGTRAVCLPTVRANTFDRRRCVVSGWGAPAARMPAHDVGQFASVTSVRVLKKIQVPIVPRTLCERSLRTTRLGKRFRLHRSFICAGGEPGRDACTGDGGSPLVCAADLSSSGRVRYMQVGIVALGIGCGNNVPGVYVNVAEFRPWIDDQMMRNGYARTFYHM